MGKGPSKIPFVIAISCLLLLVPAYLNWANFTEIDLFVRDLNFENNDQLDLQNHESDPFSLIIVSIIFPPAANRFLQYQGHFSRILSSLDQKNSILRC